MPKLNKVTKILKAKKLLTDLEKCGGDRNKLAKKMGTTRQNVSRALNKPYVADLVEKTMKKHLEEAGVTDVRLAKKVDTLLDAQKHVGMFGNKIVDDLPLQHEVLKTAMKLKGHTGTEEVPDPGGKGGVHFHLTLIGGEDVSERIREFTNKLSQINRG